MTRAICRCWVKRARKPPIRKELADSLSGGKYLDIYPCELYHGLYHIDAEDPMPRTAKLFRNGRSQAVRLPSEYRFQGSEVFIRRDTATGDVVLSRRPDAWEDLFHLMDSLGVPDDFMANRSDTPPQKRKLF